MKQNCRILFQMKRPPHSAFDREGRRKYLNRAEGLAFLREARKLPPEEALFCLTLYYIGARISEVLAVTGQDIDHSAKAIRIRTLKKRAELQFRRIPIPEPLADSLKLLSCDKADQRLWQFSRTTGWRIVKRVMKKAGIEGIHASPKGLRHGFGVRGALAKIPVGLLQTYFGHASSDTTSIYLAVKDQEERALISRTWK